MDKLAIIIASWNRPKLVKQTIESCLKNSYYKPSITVVDNSDDPETINYLESLKDITLFRWGDEFPHLRVESPDGFYYPADQADSPYWNNQWSLGKTRTKGATLAPPSEYIYFSDNDMYFKKDWDKIMIGVLEEREDFVLVGGIAHHGNSFFAKINEEYNLCTAGKQAGNSMLFRRAEWARIGYFPDYDEDSWMGYEITTHFNKKIGVIDPEIVVHCGENSTTRDGKKIEGILKTMDSPKIEVNKLKYPEVHFE